MLAYISWHAPAGDSDTAAYEQALERFHRSLAHRPPSGLRGSAVFRTAALPWTGAVEAAHVYEDWYLLDGWSSVGVLELIIDPPRVPLSSYLLPTRSAPSKPT